MQDGEGNSTGLGAGYARTRAGFAGDAVAADSARCVCSVHVRDLASRVREPHERDQGLRRTYARRRRRRRWRSSPQRNLHGVARARVRAVSHGPRSGCMRLSRHAPVQVVDAVVFCVSWLTGHGVHDVLPGVLPRLANVLAGQSVHAWCNHGSAKIRTTATGSRRAGQCVPWHASPKPVLNVPAGQAVCRPSRARVSPSVGRPRVPRRTYWCRPRWPCCRSC